MLLLQVAVQYDGHVVIKVQVHPPGQQVVTDQEVEAGQQEGGVGSLPDVQPEPEAAPIVQQAVEVGSQTLHVKSV